MTRYVDAKTLKAMFKKATEELLKNKDEINALNVFPVPDGDTGSNMVATMMEGCRYLDNVKEETLENVLKAIKDGTLMGARGNSGVILSQIIRGFAEGCPKRKNKLSPADFVNMLKQAKEVAYSAVIKPVEGTMLTVVRMLSERSKEAENITTFEELFDWILNVTHETVLMTPSMLDKLREAGVVDAGAKGLYYLFKGMKAVIDGDIEVNLEEVAETPTEVIPEVAYEELTYKYCTEYVIEVYENDAMKHYAEVMKLLSTMGDSVVVVAQDKFLKIHVHTNNPGSVLEELLKIGELHKAKIDNMKIQHQHVVSETKSERKKVGIVAVSPGEGFTNIMKSLGVDQVVKGGQTMNPSTLDLKRAIELANADVVFLFPNNPNIILAAEQAASSVEGTHVIVIKTYTPQECLSALVNYDPDKDVQELLDEFNEAIENVIPISVTRAVRNSKVGRSKIKKGEYLVFVEKDLISHSFDLLKALNKAFDYAGLHERELLTIYTGENYKESDLKQIERLIQEKFPDVDIEIYEGGQPHYPFLMSIE